MKTIHKTLLVLVGMLAFHAIGMSQEIKRFKTHEISVGVAPTPVFGSLFSPCCGAEIAGEDERIGDIHIIPLYTISYNHFYNKWFSVNIRGSVSGHYYYVYPKTGGGTGRLDLTPCVSVIGMAQFTFLNRDAVRLYSSIGLGVNACGIFLPTAQMAAFGVSFGKRLFGFLEAGSGTEYFGVNGGIGYRF